MILIRADANEQIGTGHIMRCLSIAEALVSHGESVEFVTADDKGKQMIEQNGFPAECLGTNWVEMDNEIVVFTELIKKEKPLILIVDSYYVTKQYFEALSAYTRIIYIDDMNIQTWDVDYLINYNVYADTFDYSDYESTNTKLLMGLAFAPLRSEFRNIPKHVIKDEVTDVLVSAGGADPERVTERILNELCPLWPDVVFHFVIGALNPRIKEITETRMKNAVYHVNERNMSDLMQRCDVAIAAAGTTIYELCACGIPTVTYVLANNQIEAAEQFHNKSIMFNAGDCRKNTEFNNNINTWFNILLKDKNKRIEFSETMQNMVDGKGADRISSFILLK